MADDGPLRQLAGQVGAAAALLVDTRIAGHHRQPGTDPQRLPAHDGGVKLEQALLRRILGGMCIVAQQAGAVPHEPGAVAVNERPEGEFVAGPQAGHEHVVGIVRVRHVDQNQLVVLRGRVPAR